MYKNSQTTSTKCQYQAAASNPKWWFDEKWRVICWSRHVVRNVVPIITCSLWNPWTPPLSGAHNIWLHFRFCQFILSVNSYIALPALSVQGIAQVGETNVLTNRCRNVLNCPVNQNNNVVRKTWNELAVHAFMMPDLVNNIFKESYFH
jgi:hypothetical protein